MDPLDLITRVVGWFIPIVDRILRRREEGRKGGVRLEIDLPEGRMTATRIDVHMSVRLSSKGPDELRSVSDLVRAGKLKETLNEISKLERKGFTDARLLNFKAIALYRLRRYPQALEAARAAYRIEGNDPAIPVNIANALRKLGRRRRAISWYHRAISLKDTYVPAWFGLADAYREIGRPAEGLRCYDKAIQLDSSRSDLWNNRALALVDVKDYSRAEESLRRSVELWPEHVDALGNLAKLVAGLRRFQDSIEYAERTLRLDPDHITALHSKAFSLSKLKKYEEAAQAYKEVLRRQPGDAAALGHLGSLEITLGNHEDAETHLNAALRAGYDPGRAYVDMASLRFKQGRFKEGAGLTTRALLHRQPNWVRSIAYANMAFAFGKSRRFRQAAASARRATILNAENAEAWNTLAACLLALGDFHGSETAIDRALTLRPDDTTLRKNKEELLKAKAKGKPERVALADKDRG